MAEAVRKPVAGQTTALSVQRGRIGTQARKEERYFFLFISPWIIGFIFFTAGPIIAALFFSFCYYDLISPLRWAGLVNYANLIKDELFWQALKVTAIYSAGSVALGIVAALAVAVVLNRNIRGCPFFAPYSISPP